MARCGDARAARRAAAPRRATPRTTGDTPRAPRGARHHREAWWATHAIVRVRAAAVSGDCARQRNACNAARRTPRVETQEGKRWYAPRWTRCALASLPVGPVRVQPRASDAARAGTLGTQAPAYFDGSLTVSCLRPFLRRRLSTSRPHFVSMRARKPCLRIRRVLRGR